MKFHEMNHRSIQIPQEKEKEGQLKVKPGLTGNAQVAGKPVEDEGQGKHEVEMAEEVHIEAFRVGMNLGSPGR
ncbi:hypothetical protein [Thermosulfurimonas sp. F29]|uniref:hypothetical protein n=1 Tax=Thermosulfurimonas sp. F29 TaxID=2867247 RepID=UPI001C83D3A2|nr:hypothetical protein [Thermosulfurimonas sp. F29]MBX6422218.1 hypothetical protein [Thermosulfurimonas sp. F29]